MKGKMLLTGESTSHKINIIIHSTSNIKALEKVTGHIHQNKSSNVYLVKYLIDIQMNPRMMSKLLKSWFQTGLNWRKTLIRRGSLALTAIFPQWRHKLPM